MKLSLDALKMRAEAVASEDLLATISGGTENACHDKTINVPPPPPPPDTRDGVICVPCEIGPKLLK